MNHATRKPNPQDIGREKTLDPKVKGHDRMTPEELRIQKLERLERQLYHLIGQVRELKTT